MAFAMVGQVVAAITGFVFLQAPDCAAWCSGVSSLVAVSPKSLRKISDSA